MVLGYIGPGPGLGWFPLVMLLVIGLPSLIMYFVPAVVGYVRNHDDFTALLVLNILAGWTFLGWLAALVWSIVGETAAKT